MGASLLPRRRQQRYMTPKNLGKELWYVPTPYSPSELAALPGERMKSLYPSREQTGHADTLDFRRGISA